MREHNDVTPLTSEEIDAIKTRNAARTPGNWSLHDEPEMPLEIHGGDYDRYPHPVAICAGFRCEADSAFIEGASIDIPRLLATLDAREAEIDAIAARARESNQAVAFILTRLIKRLANREEIVKKMAMRLSFIFLLLAAVSCGSPANTCEPDGCYCDGPDTPDPIKRADYAACQSLGPAYLPYCCADQGGAVVQCGQPASCVPKPGILDAGAMNANWCCVP